MNSANILIYRAPAAYVAREAFTNNTIAEGSPSEVIEAALARLPETGGCVQFGAGEFAFERPIRLRSRVTLRGSGRATRFLAAQAPGRAAFEAVGADGVELLDFSLVGMGGGAEAGVVLDGCGDCRVSGLFIKGFSAHGISLRNRSFLCRLENCSVTDCGRANYHFFELAKDGRGGDYVPNLAIGCVSYGGQVGFEAEWALVLNLVGCMVYQSRSHGFHIWRHSNSVLLSGCRTYQVGGNAVLVDDSNELNISSSIFCWTREHGIVLRRVSWGALCGNNVIDAGVRAPDSGRRHGIQLTAGTEGVQVTGNAIFSWGDQVPMAYGVLEDESCRGNGVHGNNLNFYRDGGLDVRGAGSVLGSNVAVAEPAYRGNPATPCPDFTLDAMMKFIPAQ